MAETQVFQQFKSHYQDPPPNPLPPHPTAPTSGSGDDDLVIAIPPGKVFSRYDLHIDANTVGSSASVTSAPSSGATGTQQDIKVHWAYNPFGKIAYTLTAYAADPADLRTPLTISVGDASWAQRSFDAINQRIALRLELKGPDALAFFNALRHARGQAPFVPTPAQQIVGVDDLTGMDIVLICAILAVVAVVALIVVCLICLYAIDRKFHAKVKLVSKGPLPWDQGLEIQLDPQ